jgi:hypothetical protein
MISCPSFFPFSSFSLHSPVIFSPTSFSKYFLPFCFWYIMSFLYYGSYPVELIMKSRTIGIPEWKDIKELVCLYTPKISKRKQLRFAFTTRKADEHNPTLPHSPHLLTISVFHPLIPSIVSQLPWTLCRIILVHLHSTPIRAIS